MKHIPFTAGLAVLASILFCTYLSAFRFCLLAVAAGTALVALFLFFFLRREWMFALSVISCAVLLGVGLILPGQLSAERVARVYDGKQLTCTVVLLSEPKQTSGGYWAYEAVPESKTVFSEKFIFYTATPISGNAFDKVEGTFSFSAPDTELRVYYAGRDLALSAFVLGDVTVVGHSFRPVSSFFLQARQFIRENLRRWTTEESFGLSYALLTGDDFGMTPEAYEILSDAGLTHLIAVSGMHVTVLVGFLAPFLARIRTRWLRSGIVLGVLLLLLGVAGGTPSVTRAVIMSGITFCLPLFHRGSLARNRLGLAMLLLLFISPSSALTLSFQLSFAASLGILIFSEPLFRWGATLLFRRFGLICGTVLQAILRSLALSCSAFLATLPVLFLQLGELSFTGVPATLFCAPIANGIFILGILLVLVGGSPLLPLAWAFGWFMDRGSELLYWIAEKMAVLPFQAENLSGAVRLWLLSGVVLLYGITFLGAWKRQKGKRAPRRPSVQFGRSVALLLVCVLLFSAACLAGTYWPADGGLPEGKVLASFLDVGQGNCFVSIQENRAFIVDCGGTENPGQTAAKYLISHGVTCIDFVLISHLHDDHANGIGVLSDKLPIGELIFPDTEGDVGLYADLTVLAEERNIPVTVLQEDTFRDFGGGTVLFFTRHLDLQAEDQNENSVAALFKFGKFDALLTGDITADAEFRLLENYKGKLRCDVLSVPHHGSAYSSTVSFLNAARPSYAVISVGAENSYGHPSDTVLSRLTVSCKMILRTDTGGTVEFLTDGTRMEVYQGQ